MVRVIIKGGVWRNTEDEILKAAIMKYGKNQWSRIASLLHRKSAKQCKARWFEWLDPSIKKTEWSREEDEKLLHLAKLMPTQWRTIAPIVGRTATQCLERYEQLLDDAQRKAEGLDDEAVEARKLKPGEIDPTPETKPARPDPIDMDDDELEMLSEARARLANTQGKKAKRKARERQLSEARRCASLQKHRELRAAGIAVSTHKFVRRNVVDYSSEVPFEKPVPAGFHDPGIDQFTDEDKTKLAIDDHRRKTGREIENEARRTDRDKLKKRKAEEDASGKVFEQREKKRSKLILPSPQISEKELEEIVKIGHATEAISQYADEAPTSGLLTDYVASARANAANARTLRTPANHRDTIEKEVHNLLALQNTESSLKGGINTPLYESSLGTGVTPVRQSMETPNTVLQSLAATPGTQTFGRTPGATPVGATPTPFRDQMGINQPGMDGMEQKAELRRALSSLPHPKNDFEIVAPDEEGEVKEEEESEAEWVEDAEDRKESRAKARAEARLRELQQRTKVIQRSLPHPSKYNDQAFKESLTKGDFIKADNLVKAEMAELVRWDVEGVKPQEGFSPEELAQAEQMIKDELDAGPPLDEKMWDAIEQVSSELVPFRGKLTRLGALKREDQIEALTTQFNTARDWMTAKAKKTGKVEKRVKVKLGGYNAIHASLVQKIQDRQTDIEYTSIELSTFKRLAEHEEKAINKRVGKITDEVRRQEDRERGLQKTYQELLQTQRLLEQYKIRENATTTAAPVSYKEASQTVE
ncbi:unnamed protein product, partial [Mesorhabditis belari]|uniref:Uncharacterized protein n=1 Tax=Mesorhabditis belari TaxID=2138241 RepID=A0AAF3EVG4_9BILA